MQRGVTDYFEELAKWSEEIFMASQYLAGNVDVPTERIAYSSYIHTMLSVGTTALISLLAGIEFSGILEDAYLFTESLKDNRLAY